MEGQNIIMLPGMRRQADFCVRKCGMKDKKILVAGAGSEAAAQRFFKQSASQIQIIVEDYESLMNSRLVIDNDDFAQVRIMDFANTDFKDEEFDIIYCQASISNSRRKVILKELKRILKNQGKLCIGEVVKLQDKVPVFINNIFASADIDPILKENLQPYYEESGFSVIGDEDLSDTLKDYYSITLNKLKESEKNLTSNETSYYKKLIGRISHESKVYLNQGGEKYIGYLTLLLKNREE